MNKEGKSRRIVQSALRSTKFLAAAPTVIIESPAILLGRATKEWCHMSADARIDRVYTAAGQEVARILGSKTFLNWKKGESLQVGDLIVFNNSFLYRESITGTTKSKKYLCVTLNGDAEPAILQVDGRINSTFKRIPVRQIAKYKMHDLRASITEHGAVPSHLWHIPE